MSLAKLGLLKLAGIGLGIAALTKKAVQPGQISYSYTAAHREAQARIDHMLGDGFFGNANIFLYETNSGWVLMTIDQVAKLLAANPPWANRNDLWTAIFLPCQLSTLKYNSNTGWRSIDLATYQQLITANPSWLTTAIASSTDGSSHLFGKGSFTITASVNGTMNVDWMAWKSADAAMQGLFLTAIHTDYGWSALNPGDAYKSYSYPSPAVAMKYGQNLNFFIRCSPENTGCQLLGINISVADALMYVGGAVATIVTIGTASSVTIPLLIAAVKKAAGLISNFSNKGTSVAAVAQAASDMVNIANGADITTQGGTPSDMVQVATDWINQNTDLFSSV